MAQLIVSAAGAAVGFMVGGPTGAQVGWALGSMLYSATQTQRTAGPRLDDLKVTGAAYGQPLPWSVGTTRIAGQVWWASEKREIATTQEVGKGGGAESTTYTYEVDLLIGLNDGPALGVSRIWSNGKLVYGALNTSSDSTLDASANTEVWKRYTFYPGSRTQLPDPTYEAAVGSADACAYRGRAYAFIEGLQLGSGGQLPNLMFELVTAGTAQGRQVTLLMQFDGSLVDIKGHDFAADGAGWTSEGRFGQSLDVQGTPGGGGGSNVVYSLGTSGDWDLNGSDFCIEGWMRFNAVPSRPRTLIRIADDSSAGGREEYQIVNDGAYKTFQALFPAGATSSQIIDSGVAVVAGQWYHLALARQGSTYRFFVNGAPHTSANGYRRAAGGKKVFIGNSQRSFVDGHDGDIDGLRVTRGWARYTAAFSAPSTPPVDDSLATYTPAPIPVSDAVAAVCARAGLRTDQVDTTALAGVTAQLVGLSQGQAGNARGILEQLATAFRFEAVVDDKLRFVPRGGAAVATIPYSHLGYGADRAQEQPIALTVASDLELPPQVAVSYANAANDQQTGTEVSDRLIAGQAAVSTVQLGLAMQPADAKAVADAIVADGLAGLTTATIHLPLAYARLQPTDVIQPVDQHGVTHRMRIVRRNDAGGVLTLELVADDARAIVSTGTTDTAYTAQADVTALADTVLLPLDIPQLRDADTAPGYYVAAKGVTPHWPGAVVQRSADGVTYTTVAEVGESAVIGTATTTLGDWTGGAVMDERNTLAVDVGAGELASVTRDALLADQGVNALLVGSEIVRFMVATLTGTNPNTYTLSRLLRGQRGTEWASLGHAAAERVVLLRPQGLRRVGQTAADIGVTTNLRAVTNGKSTASASPQTFRNTGVSSKPLAPVDLRLQRLVTDDLRITWKRRTRLATGFGGPQGIVVPWESGAGSFVVEVMNGPIVARTITAGSAAYADYTRAQLVADFGAAPATLTVRVCQVSDDVGRGYAALATLPVPASLAGDPATPGAPLPPPPTTPPETARQFANIVLASASGALLFRPGASAAEYYVANAGAISTLDLANTSYMGAGRSSQALNFRLGSTQYFVVSPSAAITVPTDYSTPPTLIAGVGLPAVNCIGSDGTTAVAIDSAFNVRKSTSIPSWTILGLSASLSAADPTGDPPGAIDYFPFGAFQPRALLPLSGGGWFTYTANTAWRTTDPDGYTGWTRCSAISGTNNSTINRMIWAAASIGSRLYVALQDKMGTASTYYQRLGVSTDGGATWTMTTVPATFAGFMQVGSAVVALSAGGATVAINDGSGTGWTVRDAVGVVSFPAWGTVEPRGAYTLDAGRGGVCITTADGITWTAIP